MSLIFITTWIRDIDKKYELPWKDDCERCEEDPMWTCAGALRNFYKYTKIEGNYIDPIPPYLTHLSAITKRYSWQVYQNSWQCTDIDSVNDRIRIYK